MRPGNRIILTAASIGFLILPSITLFRSLREMALYAAVTVVCACCFSLLMYNQKSAPGRPQVQIFVLISFCMILLPGSYSCVNTAMNPAREPPRSQITMMSFISKPSKYIEPSVKKVFLPNKPLMCLFNRLKIDVLGVSPLPDKVLFGKDGWLIYADENVINDYRCIIPFTAEQLHNITAAVESNREYLSRRGIRYYLLVVPNMHTVYPEQLPDYIKEFSLRSRLDQLLQHWKGNPSIPVIDIRDDLLMRKKSDLIWHRTDTHWNDLGAFIAYTRLMQSISVDFPMTPPLIETAFRKEIKFFDQGDLAKMLGMQDRYNETALFLEPGTFKYSYSYNDTITAHSPGGTMTTDNTRTHLPRMVMFHDSFAVGLIKYLSQNFSRVSYTWDHALDKGIIEKERPDLVVTEVTERYLHRLAGD